MAGLLPDYWESEDMFSCVYGEQVYEEQVEWAGVMQRTMPHDWDFDVTWVTKARRVLL